MKRNCCCKCGSTKLFDVYNHEYYCKDCFEKYIHNCESCGHKTNIYNKYCYECEKRVNIHNYGFKPEPIFYLAEKEKKKDKSLFAGVELEINFNKDSDAIKFMKDYRTSNFVYLKHDGSLQQYGIEIVSHPSSFAYHFHTKNWEKIFGYLKDTNTVGCGFHIHLSKNHFNDNMAFTLDYLINNFPYLTTQIGSRGLTHYCTQTKSNRWGYERRSHHTDACNLSNCYTIELRFCKSTNNYHSFIKKMKNVFTLIKFVELLDEHYPIHCVKTMPKKDVEYLFKEFQGELLSRI